MKKVILISIFIINASIGYSQLEHKFAITAAIATPVYGSAGNIQSENIFAGYSSIPGVRVGLQYNLNHYFGFGPVVSQYFGSKENYSLNTSQLGVAFKYNIIPFDKTISPFITLEADLNYITISQKANSVTEKPAASSDVEQIVITSQERNYPEIKTGFASTGIIIGAGTDFTLKKKYTLFVAANYVLTNSSSTYTTTSLFPENKSSLSFMLFQIGMRFAFGQSKSIY